MSVRVEHGDCREVVKALPDASVDSCVTDPPYSLVSIQKRFGKPGNAPAQEGRDGLYRRASAGFMGQGWDNGSTAFDPNWWREVYRVLKPGAHLVAFGGTRTYHRLACAIEDTGFEIRDQLAWAFGSGFPKSHNVGKGIDKEAVAEREVIAAGKPVKRMIPGADQDATGSWVKDNGREFVPTITAPATDAAAHWDGWGTALKPAWEPIVLARKPIEGTVAANVLAHGTGALNIDGCRVEGIPRTTHADGNRVTSISDGVYLAGKKPHGPVAPPPGRWPANLVHDGSDEVVALFPDEAGAGGPAAGPSLRGVNHSVARGQFNGLPEGQSPAFHGDSGSASRFFFSAKAGADDRADSKHPTVKPVALMRWLARLITPPGGLVLDPFGGSGSTAVACLREGFDCIIIEREDQYVKDIRHRIDKLSGLDAPLFTGVAE